MKSGPRKAPAGRLLFETPEKPANVFVANVDGASRGNPGPASYAVILRGPDGANRLEIGKYIGRATNNVAEYYGLISALDYAVAQGIERLLVRSDSELLVRQMQGRYKVNSADLRPLYERARKLAHGFAYFVIEHVPRELNREADELANIALDRTGSLGGGNFAPGATPAAKPSAKRGEKASTSARSAKFAAGDRVVRARYSGGALYPLEGVDLGENEIVEISIRRDRNPS